MCWPAYIVGAISISIVIFDIIVKDWSNLLPHSIGGVLVTILFWALCLIHTSLSAAVLIVPLFAFIIFFFTLWLTRESMKKRGCCIKCQPEPEPASPCEAPKPVAKCYDNTLKATPLM
jgi:hypothetical protein